MREDDQEAVYDLMAGMEWFEALRFFRAETGDSLRTANWVAERLANERPNSSLARSQPRP